MGQVVTYTIDGCGCCGTGSGSGSGGVNCMGCVLPRSDLSITFTGGGDCTCLDGTHALHYTLTPYERWATTDDVCGGCPGSVGCVWFLACIDGVLYLIVDFNSVTRTFLVAILSCDPLHLQVSLPAGIDGFYCTGSVQADITE